MINKIKNKKILIKTYLSESGLWYLAKSLGDILSENNEVSYVSKAKYKKEALGGTFRRHYPEPYDESLLSDVSFHVLSKEKTVEKQLLRLVRDNDIDIIKKNIQEMLGE